MEFKIKKDFLFIFIIELLLFGLIFVALPFAYNAWVFIVVIAIVASLIAFFNTSVFICSCKLEGDVLTYKTGAFKYVIDIKSINKTTITKNWYTSLCFAYERIRILTTTEDGKQKVYYISVVDNENLCAILNGKTQNKATKTEETAAKVEEKKEVKQPATKKVASTKTKSTSSAKKTTTKKENK